MQSLWSVLWSTGKSKTFCPSEESPLTKTHSSTKAFFERISHRDPEGIPLTYPAWHRNSLNKQMNYRQTRGEQWLTHFHSKRDHSNLQGVFGVVMSLHHTIDVLLQIDPFITRLRCAEPCVSEPVPCHLVPTPDHSAYTSQWTRQQASPGHLCCVGLHVSQETKLVQRIVLLNSGCLFRHDANDPRHTQPFVNLNRCSRTLVNLNRCSRPLVVSVAAGPLTPVRPSTPTSNVLTLCACPGTKNAR